MPQRLWHQRDWRVLAPALDETWFSPCETMWNPLCMHIFTVKIPILANALFLVWPHQKRQSKPFSQVEHQGTCSQSPRWTRARHAWPCNCPEWLRDELDKVHPQGSVIRRRGSQKEELIIWRFPKSWGYPQIIHVRFGFSIINQLFWGISILGNPYVFSKISRKGTVLWKQTENWWSCGDATKPEVSDQ